MPNPETSLDKVKEDIEGIGEFKESLSFLKEEIEFCRDNPDYKALYDKECSIKDKIPNFDKIMKMCEDFFATHPEEKVIQMSKRDVIAYAITEEPNHDEFLQRLKINTERLKLHNKLRKNKKDKIENNK